MVIFVAHLLDKHIIKREIIFPKAPEDIVFRQNLLNNEK